MRRPHLSFFLLFFSFFFLFSLFLFFFLFALDGLGFQNG